MSSTPALAASRTLLRVLLVLNLVASQFHPEFMSKPNSPHPLFRGFIAAAHQRQHNKPL